MWLVGMMGSGKSTVGRLVAERLGVEFYDTDLVVEEQAGMSISEIWRVHGESEFRRMESAAVQQVPVEGCVAAAGGGAVVDPDNRRVMKQSLVVWLQADPGVLADRVGVAEDRPLLTGQTDPVSRLNELLTQRRSAFEDVASVAVDTSSLSLDEIVDRVVGLWPN